MATQVPPQLHTQPIPPTPTRLWMPESWTSASPIPSGIADRNRIFHPNPPNATPSDLFSVQPNAGSVRGYRFVRKNDKKRQQGLFFIDGACLDNGAGPDGPREPRAGAAVVFAPSDWYNPIKDALPLDGVPHTSNRAELRAALVALGLRVWGGEGFENIILATDSEYLVLGISERIHKWKENGWKTSSGTQVKNKDLWVALYAKIREVEEYNCHVQFWLIPRAWNEADKYAKEAAALPDGERATGAGAITTPVMMMERM